MTKADLEQRKAELEGKIPDLNKRIGEAQKALNDANAEGRELQGAFNEVCHLLELAEA